MLAFPDIHTHQEAGGGEFRIVCCSPGDFVPRTGQWYSVGLHPWSLSATMPDEMLWEELADAVRHPQVLAIGEAGLDKLATAPLSVQEAVFRREALLAEETGKPVIIHLVKAVDELLKIRKQVSPRMPWVIHGFRGKAQLAQMLLQKGFYLSFGVKYQEAALQAVPLSRLFLETDEVPIAVPELYRQVAATLQMPVEQLTVAVGGNVQRVFFP